jgi:hypothetical protein
MGWRLDPSQKPIIDAIIGKSDQAGGVFERSMPSDLIRGWFPVRASKRVKQGL